MKTLNIIGNNAQFKVDETGTLISFKAFDDNNQVLITNEDTAVFNIKNSSGLVKSVNAVVTQGGYIPCLNTKDLTELPPDTYECELWITNDKKLVNIYPDTGFVAFTINENSTLQKGSTIAVTTIADFKKQLNDEVSKATQQATDNLNQEFSNLKQENDDYIKQHAIQGAKGDTGEQGIAGKDGKNATIQVGSVETLNSGSQATVTNVGTATNAILNFGIPQGFQGIAGKDGKNGTLNRVIAQDGIDLNSTITNGLYEIHGINVNNCPNGENQSWSIVLVGSMNGDSSAPTNGYQLFIDTNSNFSWVRTWNSGDYWCNWLPLSFTWQSYPAVGCPGWSAYGNFYTCQIGDKTIYASDVMVKPTGDSTVISPVVQFPKNFPNWTDFPIAIRWLGCGSLVKETADNNGYISFNGKIPAGTECHLTFMYVG